MRGSGCGFYCGVRARINAGAEKRDRLEQRSIDAERGGEHRLMMSNFEQRRKGGSQVKSRSENQTPGSDRDGAMPTRHWLAV